MKNIVKYSTTIATHNKFYFKEKKNQLLSNTLAVRVATTDKALRAAVIIKIQQSGGKY